MQEDNKIFMLTSDQIERLQRTIQEGAIIKDWCRHGGYKIFESWITSKIEDKKKDWLRAEDEKQAERLRQQTSVWLNILDEFKRWILSGDNAARILQENTKELEEQQILSSSPE